MKYTRREVHLLALCLGHCETCSEAKECKLKAKVQQTGKPEKTISGFALRQALKPVLEREEAQQKENRLNFFQQIGIGIKTKD